MLKRDARVNSPITVEKVNHHVFKTARIGQVNSTGLIDEVWNSGAPIAPDPCLLTYDWTAGLDRCSGQPVAG